METDRTNSSETTTTSGVAESTQSVDEDTHPTIAKFGRIHLGRYQVTRVLTTSDDNCAIFQGTDLNTQSAVIIKVMIYSDLETVSHTQIVNEHQFLKDLNINGVPTVVDYQQETESSRITSVLSPVGIPFK